MIKKLLLHSILLAAVALSAVPVFYTPSYAQEPSATPVVSPAEMSLKLEDFPEGFAQVSPEDLGMDEAALAKGEYKIEGFFAYANPTRELFEVVMGFTMPFEGKLKETGIEALFENPQPLFAQVLGAIEGLEAEKEEERPLLAPIGEKAKSFQAKATMNGISLSVDLLLFQRGPAVAFVLVMYPEGQKFLMDINEAGKKFDQRIISALPPELLATPTPTPKKKLFDVLKETPSPAPTPLPSPTPIVPVITLEPTPLPTPTPFPPLITPLLPTPTPKKPGIIPATPEVVVETPPIPAGPIKVSLQLEDLPAGFQKIDPAEMGMDLEKLSTEEFKPENLFIYMYPELEKFEMVMGFTVAAGGKLQQIGIDMYLENPDKLLDLLLSGMEGMEIVEKGEMPLTVDIGDKAKALTVGLKSGGISFRLDVLLFRRGAVLAFAMTMYMEGSTPLISIQEVGQKFDQRIVEALGG